EDTLETRSAALLNAVSGTHDRLSETLDDKAAAFATSLSEGQARIENTLETRSVALLNAVSGTHDRLSETLDEKAMALAISL
ncbi:hypothetical protein ACC771_23040, partial [Rhizobium ruizarguesonis]